jgi:hypothetical protein
LVRQRPIRHGKLYAAALRLLPGKAARFHEWAIELNGIHAAELEEGLRRLGFGLTPSSTHKTSISSSLLSKAMNPPARLPLWPRRTIRSIAGTSSKSSTKPVST